MLGRISNLTLLFVIIYIFHGTFAFKFYCIIIRFVSEFQRTTIFIDDIVNV